MVHGSSMIERNPLVSVIIPVYNTEKYVADSIHSVINQTYNNLEIIVVDDESPDNAYLIVEKYAASDNRVRMIRQKNMGLSGARNTGLLNCNGEYIIFLDSDDRLVVDAVEHLLSEATQNEADIVFADRFIKVDENTNKQKIDFHFIVEK